MKERRNGGKKVWRKEWRHKEGMKAWSEGMKEGMKVWMKARRHERRNEGMKEGMRCASDPTTTKNKYLSVTPQLPHRPFEWRHEWRNERVQLFVDKNSCKRNESNIRHLLLRKKTRNTANRHKMKCFCLTLFFSLLFFATGWVIPNGIYRPSRNLRRKRAHQWGSHETYRLTWYSPVARE